MAKRAYILSVDEAKALYEAAEYARKNSWHTNHIGDRLAVLNSAVRKLRRADTLHLESNEEDDYA